jgi:hypothetical protein
MIKKILIALALSGALGSAQAGVLMQESFENVPGLTSTGGWVIHNQGTPGGFRSDGWFQGDLTSPGNFSAHGGTAASYAAANFDESKVGGVLDDWLITPEFSTDTNLVVSLWLRAMPYTDPSGVIYSDHVSFGFSSGGSDAVNFTMRPVLTVPTGDWTLFTINLDAQGAGTMGRFAIHYSGAADTSNYIGLDDLSIDTRDSGSGGGTDVPEPATMLIMAGGLAGLAAARRRRS